MNAMAAVRERAPVATGADVAARPLRIVAPHGALELRGVHKQFERRVVLQDIDLSIAPGEFVAIVGYSGAGKTTLISMLAGLLRPDAGDALLNGLQIAGPGPDRGIVFQNYSLMPWLTVRENVALAVDRVARGLSAADRADKVLHYVKMVGLSAALDKKPAQLSGGMRQRVSVARALATDPQVLLLDEPLSALDALTRAQLQDEIVNIWEQDRKTVLLITNDVDEALMVADRVIPLTLPGKDGRGATLAPGFVVDLPRPRDRSALNHDPRFRELRGEITRTLIDLAKAHRSSTSAQVITLRPMTPRDVGERTRRSPARWMGMRHAALADRIDADFAAAAAGAVPAADLPGRASPGVGSATRPSAGAGSIASSSSDAVGAATFAAQRIVAERFVEFSRIVKVYPTPKGPQTVVDGFDLKMAKGEFVSLIGHSGCGKSTVLSMIAGLVPATEGVMVLGGREVREPGPDRGLVFQSPSLVPWLSGFDNVMLGVDRVFSHIGVAERRDVAAYHLGKVGLGDAMHRKAGELSNGQKQRVGIARAFALQPRLLLLDEPFGMLDALTRWELQEVLMDVWARNRVTAIMVTHDVDEAILLADRVVMMTNGPRARIGHIMDVPLERPRSRAALLAHPDYYNLRESLIGFLASCGHQH